MGDVRRGFAAAQPYASLQHLHRRAGKLALFFDAV
jgi:hypothetical protein